MKRAHIGEAKAKQSAGCLDPMAESVRPDRASIGAVNRLLKNDTPLGLPIREAIADGRD